jgi:hypothetical protein
LGETPALPENSAHFIQIASWEKSATARQGLEKKPQFLLKFPRQNAHGRLRCQTAPIKPSLPVERTMLRESRSILFCRMDQEAAMDGASNEAPRLTRVDPPHSALGAAASHASDAADAAPVVAATSWLVQAEASSHDRAESCDDDRRALQTSQLAGRLREKRRELDRREGQLNARHAQIESEARTSRLWLRERQQEFLQREAQLERRTRELEAEATRLAAAQISAERDATEADRQLAERERQAALARSEMRRWEDRLHIRESAVAGAEEKYRRLRDQHEQALVCERQQWEMERESQAVMIREALRNLDRRAAELELREAALERRESQCDAAAVHETQIAPLRRRLEEADSLLRLQLAAVAQERRELDEQRQTLERRIDQRMRELSWRADAMSDALRRQRRKLREQGLAIRQREAAMQTLREEGLRRHREALEARLAAEQLWASLQSKAPPAELTRRLAQLRGELARHERTTAAAGADQQSQMRQLAERLDERKRELLDRQRDLNAWAAARQCEIEEQAARLVAREQELDQQERRFVEGQRRWDDERRQYPRQIRELLGQVAELPLSSNTD